MNLPCHVFIISTFRSRARIGGCKRPLREMLNPTVLIRWHFLCPHTAITSPWIIFNYWKGYSPILKPYSTVHHTGRSDQDTRFQVLTTASTHRLDDGGSKHLRNVGKLLPDYTAQQSSRQRSSCSLPWEPDISLKTWDRTVGTAVEIRAGYLGDSSINRWIYNNLPCVLVRILVISIQRATYNGDHNMSLFGI
jgi:hypothetical protein